MKEGAFICPGCDFILDASFLGDDITDDEQEQRANTTALNRTVGKAKHKPWQQQEKVDFGEDAMILGDVNPHAAEVRSFQSNDAGVSQREVTQARFYIGGAVAELMNPDAIPEVATDSAGQRIRVTPFERHVLSFINGKRSVGRIQKKAAMEDSEFKTALALLADKGFVRLKGYKKPGAGSGAAEGSMASAKSAGRGRLMSERAPSSTSAAAPPSSSTALSPSSSPSSSPIRAAAPEPERTVLVSMEHVQALAQAPDALPSIMHSWSDGEVELASGTRQRPSARKSGGDAAVTSNSDVDPPPNLQAPLPAPETATLAPRVKASVKRAAAVDDRRALPTRNVELSGLSLAPEKRRFAALKDEEQLNDDDWSKFDNGSSVFAHSAGPTQPRSAAERVTVGEDGDVPGSLKVGAPAAVDHPAAGLPPEIQEADDFDAGAAATGVRSSVTSALKDPTGLGDCVPRDLDIDGAPLDVDAADILGSIGHEEEEEEEEEDEEDEEDEEEGKAEAEPDVAGRAPPSPQLTQRSTHDDGGGELPAVDIASLPTGPIPRHGPLEDDLVRPTLLHPAQRVITLPSDALMALPEPERPSTNAAPTAALPLSSAVAVQPAVQTPPALVALPGQGLEVGQGQGSKPMPLPGQTLVTPESPGFGAIPKMLVRPAPPRPSASSSIPFELRKKAERIYEQAVKDKASGRSASALMNAKLAMNFDPSVAEYKTLFDELDAAQKGKPKVRGPQAREVVFFEQASEAEGRGDYAKAVKFLEEAIAVNPRAAALYNRIGVVLSVRLQRHDEALAHLKKAVELEPGSMVYMNNFSKVAASMESVLEKNPDRGKKGTGDEKIAIKKMRPPKF